VKPSPDASRPAPVNNRFTDLRISLRLAIEGQSDGVEAKNLKKPRPAWQEISGRAQTAFNVWYDLPARVSRDPGLNLAPRWISNFFRIG